ncbi:MAG: hypothetical protein FWE36_07980 [Erysipelotrichales bacterium]|nr:hypothetical protein [Erysipelotrichales bacterium]
MSICREIPKQFRQLCYDEGANKQANACFEKRIKKQKEKANHEGWPEILMFRLKKEEFCDKILL